MSNEQTVMPS